MVLSQHLGNDNNIMIWAACCLAYFGLLRVSEFTTPSPDRFDPTTDLLLSDVAVDSCNSPTTIQITLKKAKNDQFRKGHTIYLGKLPTPSTQWMLWSSIWLFEPAPQGHCFYCQTTNHSPEHHSAQP